MCLTVIVLTDIVRAQQALPYQYAPQPYQNAFNYDRRRLNAPNVGGFGGDAIKFPDDSSFAPTLNGQRIHGTSEQYNFNARHKKDMMIQNDGTQNDDHSHRSNEVSGFEEYCVFFPGVSIEFYSRSVPIFVIWEWNTHKKREKTHDDILQISICSVHYNGRCERFFHDESP